MKVGVLGCFYGSADLLPRVLEPWIALKNEGYSIQLAAIHAQFKEYAELGFPNDDTATKDALETNRGIFDYLYISSEPLSEKEARNNVLQKLLAMGVDIVWLLDGDEMYTKEQIKDVISYVEQTPAFDYYHVHFDNRIFTTTRWEDGFFPPRIFRTDRNGGIKEFTWDNEIEYKDGSTIYDLTPGIVPKKVAHVLHYTWRTQDLEKKIAYQKKHFGFCAFRVDEKGEPAFDPDFFSRHNIPMPTLREGGTIAGVKKPIVHVVLRTHSLGNYRFNPRVVDTLGGKPELIVRCLRSLIYSLLVLERINSYEIRLTVLDDHSDDETLARMSALIAICPFETKIINLPERGNAASMKFALQFGLEQKSDFVYFVEDDYLHESSALSEMLEAYNLFSRNSGRQEVALFPVDQLDYYKPHRLEPTRVVLGNRRHWRLNTNTTSTFFVPKFLLERHFDLFMKNPESEKTNGPGGMTEEGSINVVWQNHSLLFTPIPTLAYHMHGEDQMPPFSNWKKLWDSLDHTP
jgi:hypothetical protein